MWTEIKLDPQKGKQNGKCGKTLTLIKNLQIPRTDSSTSLQQLAKYELHIFSNTSDLAVAASSYLLTTVQDDDIDLFLGNQK